MTTPAPILSLQGVVKNYGQKVAVDQVSFDIPQGSIFGLLGPNGAGKTSIIRIITGITRADEGQVLLNGEPVQDSLFGKIGYMPEERGLYKKMKVGDHLLYLARLKGLSKKEAKQRLDYWLEKFDIADWWPKRVEELSKGMQQKIQFIATVIHQPGLLILDEPFSGLDPVNTNLIKDEIYQLQQQGVSIIFSTHRMEQVEEICERIVLINNGKNILEGDVGTIKQQFKLHQFSVTHSGEWPEDIPALFRKGNKVVIQAETGQSSNELLRQLLAGGVEIQSFSERLPSLNEIFIQEVKKI